jgi:hypothetical protein
MKLKLKFFMILAFLFTTMTAGAQYSYTLTLDDNYGCMTGARFLSDAICYFIG